MSWREFTYYLTGLGPDTPLGRVVSVRAENDPEVLKHFTKEQKAVRNEYRRKAAKTKTQDEVNAALNSLKQAFIRMAGNDEKT